MKKHFYLHCDNQDIISSLKLLDNFEKTVQYSTFEMNKTYRNEYGRIKTQDAYLHILVGTIHDLGCPWCDGELEVIEISKDKVLNFYYVTFTVKCKMCNSQGPKDRLQLNEKMEADENMMNEIHSFILNKYNKRKSITKYLEESTEGVYD